MSVSINNIFPDLVHPIFYPGGLTEKAAYNYLGEFRLVGSQGNEIENYLREDFRRFVYTINLLPKPDIDCLALEIGANPYFTSILLRKFTKCRLTFTNFFGIDGGGGRQTQRNSSSGEEFEFDYINHNIDTHELPFRNKFDVVFFCEVIEHLIGDPLAAILRIKSALVDGGYLVLTTPNVSRLENVAKMLAGANIYDPYSGYGIYGRHNREYNKHELFLLLSHCGFEIETMFSSDVHDNRSNDFFPVERLADGILSVTGRQLDLGQYIFVRAKNSRPSKPGRPDWLFRSFPEAEMAHG